MNFLNYKTLSYKATIDFVTIDPNRRGEKWSTIRTWKFYVKKGNDKILDSGSAHKETKSVT